LSVLQIRPTTYSHIIILHVAYNRDERQGTDCSIRLGNQKSGNALPEFALVSRGRDSSCFFSGAISAGVFQFLLGSRRGGKLPCRSQGHRGVVSAAGAVIGVGNLLIAVQQLEQCWPSFVSVDRAANGFGRPSFVIVGALGFVWLGAWLIFYRTPPDTPGEVESRSPCCLALAKSRFCLAVHVVQGLRGSVVCVFLHSGFPQYLKVGHGFTMKEIGETGYAIRFVTAGVGN